METLFVVPAMVSPNVDPKIVPALAKAIERNIILSNHSSFRVALLIKYRQKVVTVEFDDVPDEYKELLLEQTIVDPSTGKPIRVKGKSYSAGGDTTITKKGWEISPHIKIPSAAPSKAPSKETEFIGKGPALGGKEQIEYPKGITFYHMIGLEPTFLQIPIMMKRTRYGSVPVVGKLAAGGDIERIFTIGIKVVPFQLKDVSKILNLAQDMRGQNIIKKLFSSKIKRMLSKMRIRKRPNLDPNIEQMLLAPTSDKLSNPKYLARQISLGKTRFWSVLTIFSTADMVDQELTDNIRSYKKMVKNGWGDMVIVNEVKEAAHFCTQRMLACYELPFSYLRNTMNIDNILDERDVRHLTRAPFRMRPVRSAMLETMMDITKPEFVEIQIKELIS